jgi:DNA processing protein
LTERAQDILEEILPQVETRFRASASGETSQGAWRRDLEGEDALVYDALSYEAQPVDAVIERTGLSPAKVVSVLLSLELRGRVRQLPGQHYIRA